MRDFFPFFVYLKLVNYIMHKDVSIYYIEILYVSILYIYLYMFLVKLVGFYMENLKENIQPYIGKRWIEVGVSLNTNHAFDFCG